VASSLCFWCVLLPFALLSPFCSWRLLLNKPWQLRPHGWFRDWDSQRWMSFCLGCEFLRSQVWIAKHFFRHFCVHHNFEMNAGLLWMRGGWPLKLHPHSQICSKANACEQSHFIVLVNSSRFASQQAMCWVS
jgi:hypothetical protein